MDYLAELTPNECLDSATRYMVNRGYSIDSRTDTTLGLSRSPEIGCGGVALWSLLTLLTGGLAAIVFVLILVFGKWKATVIAVPIADGKTRLTASGSGKEITKTLQEWVREELGERAKPV